MKVSELMTRLTSLDPDAQVVVTDPTGKSRTLENYDLAPNPHLWNVEDGKTGAVSDLENVVIITTWD